MKNLMKNKKFLISVIVVSLIIIAGSLGLFLVKSQSLTAAPSSLNEVKTTKLFETTSGTLVSKSGLKGTYLSSIEATDTISIACDVVNGAMESTLSPPPYIKIAITNHTDKPIVLTENGESGKFAILIFSLDKNRIPLNSFFLPPITIGSKESWRWEGRLFTSMETRGFEIRVLYYK